jgi:hypothetical protein
LLYLGGITRFGVGRAARVSCRAAGLMVAGLGALAASGSSAHAAPPLTIAVTGDSVLVTGHSGGSMTLRATRPDAVTGAPVVLGQYAGRASSGPFTVNTTTPTALSPDGDCWQQGALSSALTPDLQPGDTMTLTQAGMFGGAPSTASVAVTAEMVQGAIGPIPSCRDVAPFARNAVTGRPDSVDGGPITVSGAAQPFATGVTVSASDGSVSTAPVGVGTAQDGSWSATIPAGQVDRLARGPLTVTPVFEVPDVSTGATAHIAGAPVGVSKLSAAGTPGGAPGSPGPAALRVASLRMPASIGLRRARRHGIRASFVVPAGARVVRVRLTRAGKVVMGRVVPAGTAGSRQAVRLRGARLRRVLHRGKFRVVVRAGASGAQLGPPASGAIAIR